MGTLFSQRPRNYFYIDFKYVKSACEEILKIAKETKMSVSDVIEVYKIETQNRDIDRKVADGDIKDEQLAGFGELIDSFNSNVEKFIELIEEKLKKEI